MATYQDYSAQVVDLFEFLLDRCLLAVLAGREGLGNGEINAQTGHEARRELDREQRPPAGRGDHDAKHDGPERDARGEPRVDHADKQPAAAAARQLEHEDEGEDHDGGPAHAGQDAAEDEDAKGAGDGGDEPARGEEERRHEHHEARGEDGGEAARQRRQRRQRDQVRACEPHGVLVGVEIGRNGGLRHGHAGHVACCLVSAR